MIIIGWLIALLVAIVHILAFVWEVVLFSRPGVHRGVFKIPAADRPSMRLWSCNVGFCNLFLACGLGAGVVAWAALGNEAVGRTLITYGCLFAALGGMILFTSDRLAMSRGQQVPHPGSMHLTQRTSWVRCRVLTYGRRFGCQFSDSGRRFRLPVAGAQALSRFSTARSILPWVTPSNRSVSRAASLGEMVNPSLNRSTTRGST